MTQDKSTLRFDGADNYVATDDLKLAVNAALTLQRPLLIKGEPGTGKTMLAEEVAAALNMPLLQWHIKSTTKAQQGLYEYDAVSRLRDSQLGDERVKDIHNYIVKGVLWQAFTAEEPVVLLIDEIDKADIEFPNDLLRELDRMEFYVYETRQMVRAAHRPLVIITSNNEKELPDAFLRRCFFHYIKFPDKDTMQKIVDVHFPTLKSDLLRELDRMEFYVYETRQMVRATHRPLVIITSNNEKELPDAFLRRCFFHYIKFPDKDTMQKIVDVHFPTLKSDLLANALQTFYQVRDVAGLKKKPSTSELIDWLKLLLAEDIPAEALRSKDNKAIVPPLHGALLKNEQDVHLFERLVFMSKTNR